MPGYLLLIPLIIIRYPLLTSLNPTNAKRAIFLPEMFGWQKINYYIYQLATLVMLVLPCFLKITLSTIWFYPGIVCFILATTLSILSVIAYSKPDENGANYNGIYRYSRHPLYVAYFFYFLACTLLLNSLALFITLLILQVATHGIILAEEVWCLATFGESYRLYTTKVRRYF